MKSRMKRLAAFISALFLIFTLASCSNDADVVNENLTTDADNFKILRRVVFYNGITDNYILEITGYCSLDTSNPARYAVTCKTGKDTYKRHFLGKSDNVTMVTEQLESAGVSSSRYKVVFKPSVIVPEVEVR